MAIYNNDRDPNVMDWENEQLIREINTKHLETLKSEYINGLKEQIEMYKKLSAMNDNIIQAKDKYIAILEGKIASLN
jgi:hypothetical protein